MAITTAQLSLGSGSAQVQTLLAACRRFAMVRSLTMVPAGIKAKRLSSVSHTTKTIHHHSSSSSSSLSSSMELEHWHLQTISQTWWLYIHAQSNYPTNILKELPISIETRFSNLFSNSEIFHEASRHYQNVINQSEYDCKLQYKPPNYENENRSKLSKNRRRNIIWFNPWPTFFKEHLQQHR